MTAPKWQWLVRDRKAFCDVLAETGDPVAAAASVGRRVADAYRMRDVIPDFAQAWERALAVAWELVESRVLAALLKVAEPELDEKAVRLIDSRMALAVYRRRELPKAARRHSGDTPQVLQLREEIRALARRPGR